MNYLLNFLLAFLGGIFGAAIGGFGAFLVCALSLLVDMLISLLFPSPPLTNYLAWGPLLGPHVSFAGGVAAAAYAGMKGKISSGRDVATMLYRLKSPSVLLIGGIFGVLGYSLSTLAAFAPATHGIPLVNPIAFSITVNAILVRLLFGTSGLIGHPQQRTMQWQPSALGFRSFMIVSLGVASVSALVGTFFPSTLGMMFGLAALSLLLLAFGKKIPIVLHVAWASEYAAVMTGNVGWGIAFGILAAVIAELCAYYFLDHGDTHIDPPAMSLAIVLMILPLCSMVGAIEFLRQFSLLLALLIVIIADLMFTAMEKRSQATIPEKFD